MTIFQTNLQNKCPQCTFLQRNKTDLAKIWVFVRGGSCNLIQAATLIVYLE